MTMSRTYKLIGQSFPLCSNLMYAGMDGFHCVYRTTKFHQTNGILSNRLENCWPNYFNWKRQILYFHCHLHFLLTFIYVLLILTFVQLRLVSKFWRNALKLKNIFRFPVRIIDFCQSMTFKLQTLHKTYNK